MIEKISKLLAAADGAKTPQESEAFYAKAQALSTVHAISLAEARQAAVDRRRVETPTSKWVAIGPKRRHVNRALIMLLWEVARVNDVMMDIRNDNTSCTLYGLPSDLAMVEQLWSRIATNMVRFTDHYMRSGVWRSEQVWRTRQETRSGRSAGLEESTVTVQGWFPVTAQAARASYLDGFISALGQRLQAARREQVAAYAEHRTGHFHDLQPASDTAAPAPAGSGAALVLKEKADEIQAYYTETSRARGSWRGDRRSGHAELSARHGRLDGDRVPLHPASAVAGPAKELGSVR